MSHDRLALAVENLSKEYVKGIRVNDGISLQIDEGEIFGLLGPNGAGKTTLVSQIIGLVRPDTGRIMIGDVDVVNSPGYARQACSFQAQTQVPIAGLTARQAIELVGRIRGGKAGETRRRTGELIDRLEIGEWANKMGVTFSGGVRRLVAFCMAVVVPGRIVILDEPTNDVDPLRRRLLWQEVRSLSAAGSAVLLVTHNVLEVERAVDRLAVIDKGRVVGTGTPASLKGAERQSMRIELTFEPGRDIPAAPEFVSDSVVSGRRLVGRVGSADLAEAIGWAGRLREAGLAEEFSIGPTTLEDVYIRLVSSPEATEAQGRNSRGV